MADLLGKADPTLVQGALKVALSKSPGSMANVYVKREENMANLMLGINKAWSGLNEDWNNREKSLVTKGDSVYENIFTGKYNDQMVQATDDAVFDIKNRLKAQKSNKKGLEARKIEAEMANFAKNTKQNSLDFTELSDLSRNNELIIKGSGGEAQLLEAIFDDFNNNTNNTSVTYKNGDFVYSLGGVSMTMSELKRSMVKKDNTKPSVVQGIFNEVVTKAGTEKRLASDVYKNDVKNRIKGSMNSSNDKTNIMHAHFEGLEYSFYEALTGKDAALQDQIFSTLESLNTDIDGDNVRDTKETYLNPDNAVALQREILNNSNSDDIIAGFLTDNLFQDAYDRGAKERKSNITPGNKTDTNPYGFDKKGMRIGPPVNRGYAQNETPKRLTEIVDYLKNGTEIQYQGNEYTFRTVDGKAQWWKNYGLDGNTPIEGVGDGKVVGSADDMRRLTFFTNDKAFQGITTEIPEERIDDETGLLPSQNPFAVKGGEGQIAPVPKEFIAAVDEDENDVISYIKNMGGENGIPGLTVKRAEGNDAFSLAFDGGKNNDGTKKRVFFNADPKISGTEERAQEIWTWLHENWKRSSSVSSSSSGGADDIN